MNRRTNNKFNSKSSDKSRKDYSFKKNRNNIDSKNNISNKKNNKDFFKSRNYNNHDVKKDTQNKYNRDQNYIKENNLNDLIWGKHSVLSVLESNNPINRIWCTSEVRSSEKFFLLLKEIKSKGVLVEEVPWSRICQITGGGVHQGIALQKSYSKTISLKDLIDSSKIKSSHPSLICLDGITDPHNIGAIVRSAEALGCNGIILPQRRSAGLTGTVAKVAAGALENINICRVVNLNRTLSALKEEGFIIVGLSSDSNMNITEFEEKVPLVIVIGSEGKGLSLLTQKNCDFLLKIPLIGKTPSLNASVAAAISIFQLSKNLSKIN